MANAKISALTAATTPLAGTEVLPIVQGGATKQVSVANLTAGRAVSMLSATSTNDSTINGLTVGKGSGSATTTNTAFGVSALNANTTATGNTMIGYRAGILNQDGSANTSVGSDALYSNVSGLYNTAVGNEALFAATGNFNTAVGRRAGNGLTSGSSVTAVGHAAVQTATTSGDLTGIGRYALLNATGQRNTALGSSAGQSVSTGTQNTLLGTFAGQSGTNDLTTGSNNTIIGYNAAASANNVSNEITLGNSSIATLRCQVTTITSLSDQRDKAEIEDMPLGLDFITALRPRRFKWDQREWYWETVRNEDGEVSEIIKHPKDGSKKSDVWIEGFIAQEAQEVAKNHSAEWLNLVYSVNPDRLEMTPGKLIPILVQSIKELKSEIDALKNKLNQTV